MLSALIAQYQTEKGAIERRLEDFRRVWTKGDKEIFAELCFCILTPQSKAESCDRIVRTLRRNGLLFEGGEEGMRPYLKKTRFYKTKSRRLVEARKLFQDNGRFHVKEKLNPKDVFATREWLVENVKGIGYKEASHFLRNIGLGEDVAILDRHVLRALRKVGIVKRLPRALTKKRYLKIENKVRRFAQQVHIPLSHLDLLCWSFETNRIFK